MYTYTVFRLEVKLEVTMIEFLRKPIQVTLKRLGKHNALSLPSSWSLTVILKYRSNFALDQLQAEEDWKITHSVDSGRACYATTSGNFSIQSRDPSLRTGQCMESSLQHNWKRLAFLVTVRPSDQRWITNIRQSKQIACLNLFAVSLELRIFSGFWFLFWLSFDSVIWMRLFIS